jgi:hypothetical protein
MDNMTSNEFEEWLCQHKLANNIKRVKEIHYYSLTLCFSKQDVWDFLQGFLYDFFQSPDLKLVKHNAHTNDFGNQVLVIKYIDPVTNLKDELSIDHGFEDDTLMAFEKALNCWIQTKFSNSHLETSFKDFCYMYDACVLDESDPKPLYIKAAVNIKNKLLW